MATNSTTLPRHLAATLLLCILALGAAVLLARPAANWIAQVAFAGAEVADLQELVNLSQALLIGLFTVMLTLFVHRYPEPFFIFWYFGWWAWFFLYLCRVLHQSELSEAFNSLNSCLFLAAGTVLASPPRWDRFLRQYPPAATSRFGSPVLWIVRYYRRNPYAVLLLAPVIGLAALSHWSHPPNTYFPGMLSVLSVTVLGYGLYRRMVLISPHTALATLIFHAIYLEPQIARVIYPDSPGHPFNYLLTVSAPSLVLKPALALFVTLLALRETSEKRDEVQIRLGEAERRGNMIRQTMIQALPAACLFVQNGKIAFLNKAASELLGVADGDQAELASIFSSPSEHTQFLEQVQRDGRTAGHLTRVRSNRSGSRVQTTKWVRIHAFDANPAAAETAAHDMVLLILDRHELGLAHAVFAFAHDYLLPRALTLSGGITQAVALPIDGAPSRQIEDTLKPLASELLDGINLLREEFTEYWRMHAGTEEGASIDRSLDVACTQAKRACASFCNPTITRPLGPFPSGTQSPTLSEPSLTHCFQNLIINAIEHTHKREGRRDLTAVDIQLSYAEGRMRILIRDHGPGFSDAIIRFLTDPAGVAAETIGLGLFSLKLKILGAGGAIRAGNAEGHGGGWVELQIPVVTPTASNTEQLALIQDKG
jgi:signal transduction histidine kinase